MCADKIGSGTSPAKPVTLKPANATAAQPPGQTQTAQFGNSAYVSGFVDATGPGADMPVLNPETIQNTSAPQQSQGAQGSDALPPKELAQLRNAPIRPELRTPGGIDAVAQATLRDFNNLPEVKKILSPDPPNPPKADKKASREPEAKLQQAWVSEDGNGWMGYQNSHKLAIEGTLRGDLGEPQRNLVDGAQASVDRGPLYEQTALHGMQPDNLTQEQSQKLQKLWIDFNKKQAQEAIGRKEYDRALVNYGLALHSFQDTTSPTHNQIGPKGERVFLPWHDNTSKWSQWDHVAGEKTYPGNDSNIARGTKGLYDWFFAGGSRPNVGVDTNGGTNTNNPSIPG